MNMPGKLFAFHSNSFYKNVEETDTLINGLTLALYADITMLKHLVKFK